MSYLQPNGQVVGLGVNINSIAALSKARITAYPDLLQAALLAEQAGADSIILELRNDCRDVTEAVVAALRSQLVVRTSLQFAVTPEMLDFVCRVKPHDACLIPTEAEQMAEGGLDVVKGFAQIQAAIKRLSVEGIRVGLLVNADPVQIAAAADAGATTVELHTGLYAKASTEDMRKSCLEQIHAGVREALKQGLRVNAGHGLNYANIEAIAAIPDIAELNIGYAIVAQAIFTGWENAIRTMKAMMTTARLRGQPQ